jgi:hypothetical protein
VLRTSSREMFEFQKGYFTVMCHYNWYTKFRVSHTNNVLAISPGMPVPWNLLPLEEFPGIRVAVVDETCYSCQHYYSLPGY